MVTDPIADLLTRVRNAQRAGHKSVLVPRSKMSCRILDVLKSEGFVAGYSVKAGEGRGSFDQLDVCLKYINGAPCMRQLKRVSKPGRRVYSAVQDIPKVDCGLGLAIVSTSKGVLSDREARRLQVGGEVIALVS